MFSRATERPLRLSAAEKEKLDPRSRVTVFTVFVERSNGRHRAYVPFYTDNWNHAYFYASRTGQLVGHASLYQAEESQWRYLFEHCLDSVKDNPIVMSTD